MGNNSKAKVKLPIKKTIDVSPYYIHVDCSWRITNQKRIIIAHRDYYFPPGNQEEQAEDWSWEKNNRYDELAKNIVRDFKKNPWFVEKVKADCFGGVRIVFTNKNTLEFFPSDSLDEEFWRFFDKVNVEKKHFVVCGNGIDTQY